MRSCILQGGVAALNEALSTVDRHSVKALSISGQQHGFVPVDKSGEVNGSLSAVNRFLTV